MWRQGNHEAMTFWALKQLDPDAFYDLTFDELDSDPSAQEYLEQHGDLLAAVIDVGFDIIALDLNDPLFTQKSDALLKSIDSLKEEPRVTKISFDPSMWEEGFRVRAPALIPVLPKLAKIHDDTERSLALIRVNPGMLEFTPEDEVEVGRGKTYAFTDELRDSEEKLTTQRIIASLIALGMDETMAQTVIAFNIQQRGAKPRGVLALTIPNVMLMIASHVINSEDQDLALFFDKDSFVNNVSFNRITGQAIIDTKVFFKNLDGRRIGFGHFTFTIDSNQNFELAQADFHLNPKFRETAILHEKLQAGGPAQTPYIRCEEVSVTRKLVAEELALGQTAEKAAGLITKNRERAALAASESAAAPTPTADDTDLPTATHDVTPLDDAEIEAAALMMALPDEDRRELAHDIDSQVEMLELETPTPSELRSATFTPPAPAIFLELASDAQHDEEIDDDDTASLWGDLDDDEAEAVFTAELGALLETVSSVDLDDLVTIDVDDVDTWEHQAPDDDRRLPLPDDAAFDLDEEELRSGGLVPPSPAPSRATTAATLRMPRLRRDSTDTGTLTPATRAIPRSVATADTRSLAGSDSTAATRMMPRLLDFGGPATADTALSQIDEARSLAGTATTAQIIEGAGEVYQTTLAEAPQTPAATPAARTEVPFLANADTPDKQRQAKLLIELIRKDLLFFKKIEELRNSLADISSATDQGKRELTIAIRAIDNFLRNIHVHSHIGSLESILALDNLDDAILFTQDLLALELNQTSKLLPLAVLSDDLGNLLHDLLVDEDDARKIGSDLVVCALRQYNYKSMIRGIPSLQRDLGRQIFVNEYALDEAFNIYKLDGKLLLLLPTVLEHNKGELALKAKDDTSGYHTALKAWQEIPRRGSLSLQQLTTMYKEAKARNEEEAAIYLALSVAKLSNTRDPLRLKETLSSKERANLFASQLVAIRNCLLLAKFHAEHDLKNPNREELVAEILTLARNKLLETLHTSENNYTPPEMLLLAGLARQFNQTLETTQTSLTPSRWRRLFKRKVNWPDSFKAKTDLFFIRDLSQEQIEQAEQVVQDSALLFRENPFATMETRQIEEEAIRTEAGATPAAPQAATTSADITPLQAWDFDRDDDDFDTAIDTFGTETGGGSGGVEMVEMTPTKTTTDVDLGAFETAIPPSDIETTDEGAGFTTARAIFIPEVLDGPNWCQRAADAWALFFEEYKTTHTLPHNDKIALKDDVKKHHSEQLDQVKQFITLTERGDNIIEFVKIFHNFLRDLAELREKLNDPAILDAFPDARTLVGILTTYLARYEITAGEPGAYNLEPLAPVLEAANFEHAVSTLKEIAEPLLAATLDLIPMVENLYKFQQSLKDTAPLFVQQRSRREVKGKQISELLIVPVKITVLFPDMLYNIQEKGGNLTLDSGQTLVDQATHAVVVINETKRRAEKQAELLAIKQGLTNMVASANVKAWDKLQKFLKKIDKKLVSKADRLDPAEKTLFISQKLIPELTKLSSEHPAIANISKFLIEDLWKIPSTQYKLFGTPVLTILLKEYMARHDVVREDLTITEILSNIPQGKKFDPKKAKALILFAKDKFEELEESGEKSLADLAAMVTQINIAIAQSKEKDPLFEQEAIDVAPYIPETPLTIPEIGEGDQDLSWAKRILAVSSEYIQKYNQDNQTTFTTLEEIIANIRYRATETQTYEREIETLTFFASSVKEANKLSKLIRMKEIVTKFHRFLEKMVWLKENLANVEILAKYPDAQIIIDILTAYLDNYKNSDGSYNVTPFAALLQAESIDSVNAMLPTLIQEATQNYYSLLPLVIYAPAWRTYLPDEDETVQEIMSHYDSERGLNLSDLTAEPMQFSVRFKLLLNDLAKDFGKLGIEETGSVTQAIAHAAQLSADINHAAISTDLPEATRQTIAESLARSTLSALRWSMDDERNLNQSLTLVAQIATFVPQFIQQDTLTRDQLAAIAESIYLSAMKNITLALRSNKEPQATLSLSKTLAEVISAFRENNLLNEDKLSAIKTKIYENITRLLSTVSPQTAQTDFLFELTATINEFNENDLFQPSTLKDLSASLREIFINISRHIDQEIFDLEIASLRLSQLRIKIEQIRKRHLLPAEDLLQIATAFNLALSSCKEKTLATGRDDRYPDPIDAASIMALLPDAAAAATIQDTRADDSTLLSALSNELMMIAIECGTAQKTYYIKPGNDAGKIRGHVAEILNADLKSASRSELSIIKYALEQITGQDITWDLDPTTDEDIGALDIVKTRLQKLQVELAQSYLANHFIADLLNGHRELNISRQYRGGIQGVTKLLDAINNSMFQRADARTLSRYLHEIGINLNPESPEIRAILEENDRILSILIPDGEPAETSPLARLSRLDFRKTSDLLKADAIELLDNDTGQLLIKLFLKVEKEVHELSHDDIKALINGAKYASMRYRARPRPHPILRRGMFAGRRAEEIEAPPVAPRDPVPPV